MENKFLKKYSGFLFNLFFNFLHWRFEAWMDELFYIEKISIETPSPKLGIFNEF